MADIGSKENEIMESPSDSETYEKLPEPKSPAYGPEYDKIQLWKARIAAARKVRKEELKDLNSLIDLYEGCYWENSDPNMPAMKDKVTVNLIFATIKKELPYLYFQNPTPVVNCSEPSYELNAFATSELLKKFTKDKLGTKLKRQVRLAILDAKFSLGILKVTYVPRFGSNPNSGRYVVKGYNNLGWPIYETDTQGNFMIEGPTSIVSEMYRIDRISPREFLIDISCKSTPSDAKWVAIEIIKPKSYLLKNSIYKNVKDLSSNVDLAKYMKDDLNKKSETSKAAMELVGDDADLIRFVEIYDFENNQLLCLPDDANVFIREENEIINPFSYLKFNERPDSFYPLADVKMEKPLVQEINIGRSLMITHARRSARKYYYGPSTFGKDEDDQIKNMKDPEDMAIFKIQDYNTPPKALDMAPQDPSVYGNLIQARLDYNEISNTTEAQRGMSERRKTKGEATFQENHGNVRRIDKQSLVADFIVDTYENLVKLMQITLTTPQAVKISGKNGIFWTQIENKNLQGDFTYSIEVSDLNPQIPEVERGEIADFIMTLTNLVNAIFSNQIGPILFNVQGMVKELAKSYPYLKVENILNGNITPEQLAQIYMNQISQQGGNTNATL